MSTHVIKASSFDVACRAGMPNWASPLAVQFHLLNSEVGQHGDMRTVFLYFVVLADFRIRWNWTWTASGDAQFGMSHRTGFSPVCGHVAY